jgi:hypothetical protein
MADLGFGAIAEGPIGDQGLELNYILTNQVGGSTVAAALIIVNGVITTEQIQRSDLVALVYNNGVLNVEQTQQHTNAVVLVEDLGTVTTKQVQYTSVQGTVLITAGGLLSTKQVQSTQIYALIRSFARAATAQIAQSVSISALMLLRGNIHTKQVQFARASGKVILYTSVNTYQIQTTSIAASIEDIATVRTTQVQTSSIATTQASVGSTNTEQVQTTNTSATLIDYLSVNTKQIQTVASRAKLILYANVAYTEQVQTTNTSATLIDYLSVNTKQIQTVASRAKLILYANVAYDVFDDTAVSIFVSEQTFIPEGSTITWDGAPSGLVITNTVDPPVIENLVLNIPVTVAAGTTVTIELIYAVYGSVTTEQVQRSAVEVQLINPPKLPTEAGGSGVYYGPFGAPFLIPLDQDWWPYGRKKRDRIEIATRFSRMERWRGVEYDTTKAPPKPKIFASTPQIATPRIREDLFTVRTTAPTLLPRKKTSVMVSDPRYIRTGSVGIGDFVVRESGEIVINNLRPVDFLVEAGDITESSYSVNAKIQFNKNYTVGIKFDDPDLIED